MSNQPSTTIPEVHLTDGQLTTTSLNIAKVFGKAHKHVIASIRNLDIPQEFSRTNFGLRDFKCPRGKTYPMYEISRDGFTLLVMGFTGKKAMQFKLAYIQAFNDMETELDSRLRGNDEQGRGNPSPAQQLADIESRYQSQLIEQQTQLIHMTNEAYHLAKEHIVLLKRGAGSKGSIGITFNSDSYRPDRFIRQVQNALKLYPNLNKTQLLAECGYNKDDKTARNWLDAFEGIHWYCRKRSGVYTYNLNVEELDIEVKGALV